MGKVTYDPSNQTPSTTTHFSHPHLLKLINYHSPQQTPGLPSSCSGCKLCPSGSIYSCTACPYFLHEKCFKMPKSITHPCHKAHTFTLLPQPKYASGLFKCDACGENGNGFSYHCKPCGIDLHILCASMPLNLNHGSHPHELDLVYECPYSTKIFSCDICKINGSNHWLYRCSSCGFDAHLKCAKTHVPPSFTIQKQSESTSFTGFQSQRPGMAGSSTNYRSAPQLGMPQGGYGPQFGAGKSIPNRIQQQQPMMNYNINTAVGVPTGPGGLNLPQFGMNRQNQAVVFQQMINTNNAMAQAWLAAGLAAGGYGGGNNNMREFQQLMHMFSGVNRGGGIGGGAIPGFGGQDFLSLMNNVGFGGSGGGGIDLNGFDFLGGLGGFC